MKIIRALALLATLAPAAALAQDAGTAAPAAPEAAAETQAPAPVRRTISTGQGEAAAAPVAEAPHAIVEDVSDAALAEGGSVLPGEAEMMAEAMREAAAAPTASAGGAAAGGAAAGDASGTVSAEPAPAPAAAAPAEITADEVQQVMAVAAASNPAVSAERAAEAREQLRVWDGVAARASTALTEGKASTSALEVLRETLVAQRTEARAMAEAARNSAKPYRVQLDALGPAPESGGEPRETAIERMALENLIATLEGRARQADLSVARAGGLIDEIDGLIRDRFAEQLQIRGPGVLQPEIWWEAGQELYAATEHLVQETSSALTDPVLKQERRQRLPMFLVAVVFALVMGVWARRKLVATLTRAAPEDAGRGRRVAVGAAVAATRLLLPALALAIFIYGLRHANILGFRGEQAMDQLVRGLLVLIAAQGVAWAYYSPSRPRFRMSALEDGPAMRATWLSVGLGLVYFAESVLVGFGEAYGYSAEALAALNIAILSTGGVLMWALAGYVRPPKEEKSAPEGPSEFDIAAYQPASEEEEAVFLGRRLLILGAFLMRVVAAGSVLLALAGYYAASRYAFFPTMLTVGLLAAGVLLFTMIREGVEGYLSEDDGPAARAAGGGDGAALRLIPIFAGFVLILALIPELALIWGARPADLIDAWGIIANGMMLGETRISPIDFITFALVFLAVYTVMHLLQTVLRRSVLPNTRLDSGARNAISSFVGYAGFAIAALAAISAAGLDLSSLAIVAGALSVGIGFGLQNVVNNFVSGVILLVERPIKVGDWINVNGTHGNVKKISVRATEIETFDRAAYIVPNGDLISSPVMNMTHGNNVGRLILPVGVAYGTDTRKVAEILEKVSISHSAVLRYPAPQVLFMEFGADSLNFEIRCILRDVGQTLAVRSHMHFEIDRLFREAEIEIPFAQRDLHLRNPEALGDAMGRALASAMGSYAQMRRPEPVAAPAMPPMAPGEGRRDPAAWPPETDPRPADQRGEADADGQPDGDDPR